MTSPTVTAERWEQRIHLGAHPLLYPLIRGLGHARPVLRLPGLGVLVSEAGLVREVLMDQQRFVKNGPTGSGALWTPVVGPKALVNMDGAEHRELRQRLGDLFTPRSVAGIVEPAAGALHARIHGELDSGRALDLVDCVKELAGGVIARLLGVPDNAPGRLPDRELFNLGSSISSLVRLGRPTLTVRQIAKGRSAVGILAGPATAAYRDSDPGTFPGRLRELGMSEDEAMGIISAFVMVGTETLVSFVPRLVALLADTGRVGMLAKDRSALPGAINEALRFTVPSPMMLRDTVEAGVIGGTAVRAGDRILLSTIHAAKSLGGFDPSRAMPPQARQLWFGAGPHFCIGMPLAMAEIHASLDVLLNRYIEQPWTISGRRISRGVLIPGYKSLELSNAQ
ncbi:Cytochrome P450 [Arthrobacter sp. yr096]|uniref:cytochrome P450 n=1 Tax=unclassified Arthrobacter TaxID=235627 RepID=UPI000897EC13|nr:MULTISPECIES: cytochrome P450 [unclassified Arthrobacter]SDW24832.1 Cytochrome P450 [Arthrobacter sp. cf158]SEI47516.1 Cytochrome P450 [Arthrobacter sp. yr096]